MSNNQSKQIIPEQIQSDEEFFEDLGFKIEITADESPSLRLVTSTESESMHHSKGAAAETQYIYASVIDSALKCYIQNKDEFSNQQLSACVVGLGLGYIEIAWAQQLLKNQLSASDKIFFDSFEIVEKLREHFLQWIASEQQNERSIYTLISRKLSLQCNDDHVRKILSFALENRSRINSDITDFKDSKIKWNIICFDAFSQKTSQGLWHPDFLDHFLLDHADDHCVFTTYACTSTLKKALQKANFQLIERPGFGGKRESTLAVKGVFTKCLRSFQIF